MSLRSAVALSLAVCLATPAAVAAAMTQEEMNRTVGAFYSSTTIDEANAFDVSNLTITKDIGTFTLKKGTLYLTKPIEGMVATAVFVGDGAASIKPTRAMDRKCLDLAGEQHLGKKPGGQLSTGFNQMVLVSFDGTLDGLVKSLTTKSGAPDVAGAAKILKDRMDVMNTLELPFDFDTLSKKLGVKGGPLYLDFKSAEFDWLEFGFQARSQYEVGLWTLEKVGSLIAVHTLINTHQISDFDSKGSFTGDAVKDQKDWVDIKTQKMEITIPDTQHFLVETDVTFTPLTDALPLVYFDLRNNIPVPGTSGTRSTEKAKSIILSKLTDASGKAISFVHQKHRVWVVPAEPFKLGQDYTLHFSLNEDTIVQLSSVHYLVLNDYPWYPQHGYVGGLSKMDWTIKAKKPLYATGSGRIVKDTTEGAFNVTQLVFDQDVWLPCLIFGQYQKQVDTYKSSDGSGTVNLTVFSAPQADFTLTDDDGKYFTVSVTVPGNKPRDVLEEAKQIIKFDEALYGLFPYGTLQVAQMSPGLGFGQSPPGFVQLTGEAFMSSERLSNIGSLNPDFFHEFFAHEISHQWWAHEIKWAADEDVWLSESFAEYSAGLYVMQLLGPDRFQGKIKVWKDNAKIADPHAPIAWANNVSGPNAGLWRTGLIYNKGPYVVHMLRMQVGHENFVKAMKNLMVKYRNQEITTDQLKQEFEAVVGYKLDYFFDQWFRGTGIPTFDYSSSVKQTEDGKWLATVNISQRDKENVKIVSMPVFFHISKDKVFSRDRPILKAEDVFQIKLPEKPTSITLDDYHTLLADIVAQGATGQ